MRCPRSASHIGVVSVFAVIATWKDYLWPLLVLRHPDQQPLSVRLPILAPTTDLGVFIAALTISSLIPIPCSCSSSACSCGAQVSVEP